MSYPTPQVQDMFSRYMAERFDQKELLSMSTGFQSFFGRPDAGGKTLFSPDALIVDIDVIKGNEKTAALVPRGNVARMIGGTKKNLQKEKFSSFSRKFPLSEEEADISAHQLLFRSVGETPYMKKTQLQRVRELAYDLHVETVRRHIRLFERLSAQAILTGKMDAIIGGGVDEQFDFRRAAGNTVAAPLLWTNALADIDADFNNAWDQGRTAGKVSYDGAILGKGAMAALIKSSTMKDLADNRRYEMVRIGANETVPAKFSRFITAGMSCFGKIMTTHGHEFYLFTYQDQYDADNGVATLYMPTNQVLFFFSGARCDRYFGPSERMPVTAAEAAWYREVFGFNMSAPPMPPKIVEPGGVVVPGMFYCDAYEDIGHKTVTIRTQTAPIFAPIQTDAFYLLHTVV